MGEPHLATHVTAGPRLPSTCPPARQIFPRGNGCFHVANRLGEGNFPRTLKRKDADFFFPFFFLSLRLMIKALVQALFALLGFEALGGPYLLSDATRPVRFLLIFAVLACPNRPQSCITSLLLPLFISFSFAPLFLRISRRHYLFDYFVLGVFLSFITISFFFIYLHS